MPGAVLLNEPVPVEIIIENTGKETVHTISSDLGPHLMTLEVRSSADGKVVYHGHIVAMPEKMRHNGDWRESDRDPFLHLQPKAMLIFVTTLKSKLNEAGTTAVGPLFDAPGDFELRITSPIPSQWVKVNVSASFAINAFRETWASDLPLIVEVQTKNSTDKSIVALDKDTVLYVTSGQKRIDWQWKSEKGEIRKITSDDYQILVRNEDLAPLNPIKTRQFHPDQLLKSGEKRTFHVMVPVPEKFGEGVRWTLTAMVKIPESGQTHQGALQLTGRDLPPTCSSENGFRRQIQTALLKVDGLATLDSSEAAVFQECFQKGDYRAALIKFSDVLKRGESVGSCWQALETAPEEARHLRNYLLGYADARHVKLTDQDRQIIVGGRMARTLVDRPGIVRRQIPLTLADGRGIGGWQMPPTSFQQAISNLVATSAALHQAEYAAIMRACDAEIQAEETRLRYHDNWMHAAQGVGVLAVILMVGFLGWRVRRAMGGQAPAKSVKA